MTAGAVNLVDAAYTDIGPLEILQRRDVDEIVVIHGTCNCCHVSKALTVSRPSGS